MRFACWKTKTTDTHSEYVILIENRTVDDIMWLNMVDPDRPQMSI